MKNSRKLDFNEDGLPTEMSGDVFDTDDGEVEYTKECLIKTRGRLELGYYIPKSDIWVDRETILISNVIGWRYLDDFLT